MKRYNKIWILSLFLGFVILSACSYNRSPGTRNYNPNDPGFVFAPAYAMYHSIPRDPLTQEAGDPNPYHKNGMTMYRPPQGAIARGKLDYYFSYPNTPEGYEKAGNELKTPLKATKEHIAEGKRLFISYCAHCHGNTGNSDGPVMNSGKFPKPHFNTFQSEYIDSLPVGKMYHTITYGRNLMGSHASQLSPKQRWLIILYIDKLRNES